MNKIKLATITPLAKLARKVVIHASNRLPPIKRGITRQLTEAK